MDEVTFIVEASEQGGYIAKAIGVSIFTEGDTMELLRDAVKEAVHCHYDDNKARLVTLQ